MRFTDFLSWYSLAELCLFFAAFALLVISLRQRRYGGSLLGLLLLAASYLPLQAVLAYFDDLYKQRPVGKLAAWFTALPVWVLLGTAAVTAAVLLAAFISLWRRERSRITPMSVKEATDSLPAGLCFYLEGGRVVLVNRTMEALCRALTGGPLANGERFREELLARTERPEAEMPGPAPLLFQPDGTVWSFSESEERYQNAPICLLMVFDVTELYRKTQSLRRMREELEALNRRLTDYYREAAALTAQKEILEVRVRLHDEMGADLLMMRRLLREGGTEKERRQLDERLRRHAAFLKEETVPVERDEYRLLFETAERLNGQILVEGELPREEPFRHIIATALHECFTNTLRHAHGRTLRLRLEESPALLRASFTNDGLQPEGPVREQGGLRTLRSLTEGAGGRMSVSVDPEYVITLELPKEVPHALSSTDR